VSGMSRMDRNKRALGGAIKRTKPGRAALIVNELGLAKGRTLDFGCGYGFDARYFGWEAYDPYYGPSLPAGYFDTVVCLSVINALSRNNRTRVIGTIQHLLTEEGNAYLSVPRDLPICGKLGMHHSLQNYVVLTLPGIFRDSKLEIYHLRKTNQYKDKTREFLSKKDKYRCN
jgi:2-polyprenyl-3-methyl-5-hydroxy-6-metoxy-1,4-benzoquinol methylase